MVNILMVSNYDDIEKDCDKITPINASQIEILLDSASYYERKHKGELDKIQDLYDVDATSLFKPSQTTSPVKNQFKEDTPNISANFDSQRKKSHHLSPNLSVEKKNLFKIETKSAQADQEDKSHSPLNPLDKLEKQSSTPSEGLTPLTSKPYKEQ
jgi:hypothetical protein